MIQLIKIISNKVDFWRLYSFQTALKTSRVPQVSVLQLRKLQIRSFVHMDQSLQKKKIMTQWSLVSFVSKMTRNYVKLGSIRHKKINCRLTDEYYFSYVSHFSTQLHFYKTLTDCDDNYPKSNLDNENFNENGSQKEIIRQRWKMKMTQNFHLFSIPLHFTIKMTPKWVPGFKMVIFLLFGRKVWP